MVEDGSQWEFPGQSEMAALMTPRVGGTLVVGLAAADIVLTLVGIQACFQEENPVARWVLMMFGPAGLVGLKSVALGVLGLVVWQLPSRYGRAAIGGFFLTQLFAVGWNAMLVSSQASVCG